MSVNLVSKRVVLHFPHRLVDQPIICRLVKEHNLDFNILKAYVTPREEGLVVLELSGKEGDFKKGFEYLKKVGVKIQPLSQDVIRNDDRCTHCGACVTVCPAGALVLEPVTRKVHFYENKCIACELCVKACPTRAMEIRF
ncbi:MAG: 4Fe-4S binding protein [Candidatus Omnitrophica bacterium]|nr:4Fe-4S binding protein [Candidatus Omnitrophota bacterium]